MTTLYIVRHAYAGQHGDARYPDDSQRPLTPSGIKQFSKAVKKLVKRGFGPQIIATSPFVRCRQTAEIICDLVMPTPELVELEALEPGSDLEALLEWSNTRAAQSMAWVGHAPDVDHLSAGLLQMPSSGMSFRKGAIAALEFDEDELARGAAQLRYFVAPADLGCPRSKID